MSADVIVVGAGVAGAATAFHLSRLGAGDVLVVDRDTAGSGMSSRSSAMIRMHYTFRPEVELAVRSDRMFDAWTELTGRPAFVRRTGFARIVRFGEEGALRANVAMQRYCGARAEVLGAAGFAAVAPGIRTDDLTEVAWEPNGGYGDGALVAGDLLAAARERGVRYRPHTPVRGLLRKGDRVTGIQTQDGPEHAAIVVAAAGVWSPALLASIGVDLPIETEFHQVAVLSHAPGRGTPVACIDSTTQTYFRPEAGGTKTLVGSFTGPRGVDPDCVARPGLAQSSGPADGLAALVGGAAHRLPALAEAGIAHGITGVYDMTPDGRPLLGGLPGLSGLVLAAGFSGTGFKISPAVGEAVAALVTGSPVAGAVDIGPFRPGRFAEGLPVTPPFPYSDD
jgi:glycine/D-amino acid oxidase-like deaminating enzyme